MIERLTVKNTIDVIEFLKEVKDYYFDFYITLNKERIFLKNKSKLIKKILKHYEVYGKFEQGSLKSLALILREKGFRPYLKILAISSKEYEDLLRIIKWNFLEEELFVKIKKDNPLYNSLQRNGFRSIGNRGKEILLKKERIKLVKKLIAKDSGDDNDNHY